MEPGPSPPEQPLPSACGGAKCPHADSVNANRNSLSRLLLLASAICAAAFAVSLLFGRFWVGELLCHFRVQFAIAMLLLTVGLVLVHRRFWTWCFGMLTLIAAGTAGSTCWPAPQPATGNEVIRIMSANVLNSNWHVDKLIQLVHDIDPDVLVIVEYTLRLDEALTDIKLAYPHHILCPRGHGFGIGVFSKRSLHESEVFFPESQMDAPAIACQVDCASRRFGLTAVHTYSPMSANRMRIRNRQLDYLATKVQAVNIPQVVVGDFNATTWSPYLSDFLRRTNLRDSRRGFGILPTWPQFCFWLLVPIDHAFVSPEFHVHRRWVEGDVGSDHYPIVLELSLSGDSGEAEAEPLGRESAMGPLRAIDFGDRRAD
jgi:endonuclease/exonuclease/phosphatase (EEP) superfamily protein YafD